MPHVIKNYPKPDPECVAKFAGLPSATIYEAAGKRGAMSSAIRPAYPGARLYGTAVTVRCHVGDNLMLHKAITVAGPGDVIVADFGMYDEAGAWGEITTTAAIARGVAGLVIDGRVRDIARIQEIGFPVFSRGLSIKGTTKEALGEINHPVVVGGVPVNPGDIVVGDADGVVVVPATRAYEVLQASLAREAAEAKIMEQLRQGKTTLELLGFGATLQSKGLTEE
ncbi:MAG: 4-carboxy-4-hydroxy-2-oxoadipate aldolase/oxaloacetate decarboxylase [Bacillota bacterium]